MPTTSTYIRIGYIHVSRAYAAYVYLVRTGIHLSFPATRQLSQSPTSQEPLAQPSLSSPYSPLLRPQMSHKTSHWEATTPTSLAWILAGDSSLPPPPPTAALAPYSDIQSILQPVDRGVVYKMADRASSLLRMPPMPSIPPKGKALQDPDLPSPSHLSSSTSSLHPTTHSAPATGNSLAVP